MYAKFHRTCSSLRSRLICDWFPSLQLYGYAENTPPREHLLRLVTLLFHSDLRLSWRVDSPTFSAMTQRNENVKPKLGKCSSKNLLDTPRVLHQHPCLKGSKSPLSQDWNKFQESAWNEDAELRMKAALQPWKISRKIRFYFSSCWAFPSSFFQSFLLQTFLLGAVLMCDSLKPLHWWAYLQSFLDVMSSMHHFWSPLQYGYETWLSYVLVFWQRLDHEVSFLKLHFFFWLMLKGNGKNCLIHW